MKSVKVKRFEGVKVARKRSVRAGGHGRINSAEVLEHLSGDAVITDDTDPDTDPIDVPDTDPSDVSGTDPSLN